MIPNGGWIKLVRSDDTFQLIRRSPKAYVLLNVIALRARWKSSFVDRLDQILPGQALIGDHKNCGLSEGEYRAAKALLEKCSLATFKATSRGTIATLSKYTLENILQINIQPDDGQSDGQSDGQETSKRRTHDGHTTTNREGKEGKKAEREQSAPDPGPDTASRPAPEAERPSLEEVQDYAQFIGLAPWKANDWFDEMQGGGWLDHQHRPVSDWRAVARRVKAKWEADGRPSGPPGAAQRQADGNAAGSGESPNHQRPTTDAHAIRLQKELERVEDRLKSISNHGTHTAFGVTYTPAQKEERMRLITRKKEILTLLGFQA